MELTNNNIKVKTKDGEIKSIKYDDTEILYQGDQGWKKTFPVIFPVVGFSESFVVEGKNYKIPKHGFWKDLQWEEFIENGDIVLSATHIANDIYPFTIDIQQFISISKDTIQIETHIANISATTAYFHFGYHPAFNIDDATSIIYSSNKKPLMVSLESKLEGEYELTTPLMQEPFGKDFDTLVYKDVDTDALSIKAKGLTVTVSHDANNLQLWKPTNDEFICIEPWYGTGDKETTLIKEAKDKKEINSLESGQSWKATMMIKITK